MTQAQWDTRFLRLAREVASWSKDPSTQVGAVIADPNNRVVSIGFNGFARGVRDDERMTDRELKYEMTVHAEVNAILFAGRQLTGCSIYVWPLPPCARCASVIIQAGLSRVVAPRHTGARWEKSCVLGEQMLHDAGVSRQSVRLEDDR